MTATTRPTPTVPTQRDPARPEATVSNADDIVDLLLDQHQQLHRLCTQVQAATGADRKLLFADLTALVHRHELGEQTVVHPVTRDHTKRDGDAVATICAAQEEHAGRAIAPLADLGVDHPSFPARFAAFHQTLLEHLAYEERDEFPRLRRYVPTQRLHTMANHIRNVRAMP
jgi:Hemerythrin HHE cation binding domain